MVYATKAIMMEEVSNDLFSERFPGAQINSIKMSGDYVSESITKHFLKAQIKTRFSIEGAGIHRAMVIAAQTGKGKNHAVHYVFRPVAADYGWKILYLCNRRALGQQQIQEAEKAVDPDSKPFNIKRELDMYNVGSLTIMTYHRYFSLLCKKGKPFFSQYRIVVADEAHFFCSDALFNADTWEILKSIPDVFNSALRIYMTATPEDVLDPIYYFEWNKTEGEYAPAKCKAYCEPSGGFFSDLDKLPKLDVYSFPYDYSAYSDICYFSTIDILKRYIIGGDWKDEKWIIFVTSKEKGRNLKEFLEENNIKAVYVDRESRNSSDFEVSKTWEKLQLFGNLDDCQVLITTSVLDNGFSIKDSKIRHVVLFTSDRTEFLQELGRVRLSGKQKLKVYFPQMSKGYFSNNQEILHNFCLFYGSKNIREYPDYAEIQGNPNSLIKRIVQSGNSIGYLTTDTVFREGKGYEAPRINDMARWKAHCIRHLSETYNELFLQDPENASIQVKLGWLEGDTQTRFKITNIDVPEEKSAAKELEKYLDKYVDMPMRECSQYNSDSDDKEESFFNFSKELQELFIRILPEEKTKVNTGKNRSIWKHKAIISHLEQMQEKYSEYLSFSYSFELSEEDKCWHLKRCKER